ncbi:MAG: biotin/lipoyl-binding protein, partial [Nitrobacter sp.]
MATEQSSPVSRRKLGIAGVAALCVAVAIVVVGIAAREKGNAELRTWTDKQAIPTVAVIQPDAKILNATLDVPGRLEAYSRAPIFARVSGYLKNWYVDIGAKVKAGQLLAEIEAPDLDQQLLQARADLASQQASAKLSEATLNRRKSLLASNFVSMQEIDEKTADLAN